MALYEMRTYVLYVGKLDEAVKHYQELGWPALEKGGFHNKLLGYFISDVGGLNKLVHLWKFEDDVTAGITGDASIRIDQICAATALPAAGGGAKCAALSPIGT